MTTSDWQSLNPPITNLLKWHVIWKKIIDEPRKLDHGWPHDVFFLMQDPVSESPDIQQPYGNMKTEFLKFLKKVAPYLKSKSASPNEMTEIYKDFIQKNSPFGIKFVDRDLQAGFEKCMSTGTFENIDSTGGSFPVKKMHQTLVDINGCPQEIWWNQAKYVMEKLKENGVLHRVVRRMMQGKIEPTLWHSFKVNWNDDPPPTTSAHSGYFNDYSGHYPPLQRQVVDQVEREVSLAHSGHYNQLSMSDDHYENEIRHVDSHITKPYPHRYQVDDYLYPQERVDYANMRMNTYGGHGPSIDGASAIIIALMLVLCVSLTCIAIGLAICWVYTFYGRVFERKKQPVYVYRRADDVDEDCNL
eukprot:48951_1